MIFRTEACPNAVTPQWLVAAGEVVLRALDQFGEQLAPVFTIPEPPTDCL